MRVRLYRAHGDSSTTLARVFNSAQSQSKKIKVKKMRIIENYF